MRRYDEVEQDNVSIQNQEAIIKDFVKTQFPGSSLTFFENHDCTASFSKNSIPIKQKFSFLPQCSAFQIKPYHTSA